MSGKGNKLLGIRLSFELRAHVDSSSFESGVSASAYVRRLIEEDFMTNGDSESCQKAHTNKPKPKRTRTRKIAIKKQTIKLRIKKEEEPLPEEKPDLWKTDLKNSDYEKLATKNAKKRISENRVKRRLDDIFEARKLKKQLGGAKP